MKTFTIISKKRTDLGKASTKTLRSQGLIPCVMYGGEETIHFTADEAEVKKLIYSSEVFLIELDLDGKKYKAVMHELQFHPVTDKVLHIDFIQVFADRPAVVSLPIRLTGSSKGILAGGKLRLKKRYLKVQGLINNLPEELVIDITELKIGEVIKVSNLKFDKLEILEPGQSMVVGIVTSRVAAKGTTAAEGAEETAENEAAEPAKAEA
ncbi:MAG: 50S ribosomal protein L25/general stress protein Ctc [Bacteroidota bacterium]|nr:MAG: 50S ribosomal protein L25/general stress protein Ctc [Bacteroidota bacterium]